MRDTVFRSARWRAALAIALLWHCIAARADAELVVAVARLPLSLPIYVAQAQGYFAKEGIRLRIADCDIGRECLDRLLGGAADVATVGDSPMVLASLRGARFALFATMTRARNYTKIVARRDGAEDSVADLRGRRVGTVVGTSAQYFLDASLVFSQVEPQQVSVVPLEPEASAAALRSGKVDAVAIFEPYAFQAARLLGSRARVLPNAPLHRENWNLVATEAALQGRQAELSGLCRALARADAFIARHPASARAILRRRLDLDEPTIDWVWPDLEFRLQLSQSLVASLEGQARWAIHSGYAAGPAPDYLGYIRREVLSAALPDAVTLAP